MRIRTFVLVSVRLLATASRRGPSSSAGLEPGLVLAHARPAWPRSDGSVACARSASFANWRAIKNLAHLPGEVVEREGLGEQFDPRIDHAVMDDRVLGVA